MFGALVLAICSFSLGMVVGERSANEANKKREAVIQEQVTPHAEESANIDEKVVRASPHTTESDKP